MSWQPILPEFYLHFAFPERCRWVVSLVCHQQTDSTAPTPLRCLCQMSMLRSYKFLRSEWLLLSRHVWTSVTHPSSLSTWQSSIPPFISLSPYFSASPWKLRDVFRISYLALTQTHLSWRQRLRLVELLWKLWRNVKTRKKPIAD